MKKTSILVVLFLLTFPLFGHAQHSDDAIEILPTDGTAPPPPVPDAEEFYRGQVLEIINEYQEDFGLGGTRPYIQTIKVKFLEGPREGEETTIDYGVLIADQKLQAGQKVILLTPNDTPYIFDRYRLPALGGIIIGALGVLDDITTSQTAAVYQIWRANPSLSPKELFKRGTAVGKEHITSLINTLALAYVGASFPALLLFTVYQRPWWVVTNTEAIAEEIIRTLVGSTALMIAVPITTFIPAYWLPKALSKPEDAPPMHPHAH